MLEVCGKKRPFCRCELRIFRRCKRGEEAAVAVPDKDNGDKGDGEDPVNLLCDRRGHYRFPSVLPKMETQDSIVAPSLISW